MASQLAMTSSFVVNFLSPKTWGWRRIIFSRTPAATSDNVKFLFSLAIWLSIVTWSRTSPSSSLMCSMSPEWMASTSSCASSRI